MHSIEGAVLLNLLLLLHGTWGNDSTCGVGLITPGGEYYVVHVQRISEHARRLKSAVITCDPRLVTVFTR